MESLLSLSITDTPNNLPIHHDQLSPILTELEANTVPDTPNNLPIHHDQLSPILTKLEANTVPDTTQITTSI